MCKTSGCDVITVGQCWCGSGGQESGLNSRGSSNWVNSRLCEHTQPERERKERGRERTREMRVWSYALMLTSMEKNANALSLTLSPPLVCQTHILVRLKTATERERERERKGGGGLIFLPHFLQSSVFCLNCYFSTSVHPIKMNKLCIFIMPRLSW